MYELVVGGKKIVGCAQRRFKNSFLEHGSIPLRLNRNKIFNILKDKTSSSKKIFESLSFENSAGLHELGSCLFPIDQIIENIVTGFEDYFGISFEEENLSAYEEELAQKIARASTICKSAKSAPSIKK
jgi:lipoate-protein ligase A